jgi:hypothetical protein
MAAKARGASDPRVRAYARLALGGLSRGGTHGDEIRHGILNIMREHGIREGNRPVRGGGGQSACFAGLRLLAGRSAGSTRPRPKQEAAAAPAADPCPRPTHPQHTPYPRAWTSRGWSSGTRSCTRTRRPRTSRSRVGGWALGQASTAEMGPRWSPRGGWRPPKPPYLVSPSHLRLSTTDPASQLNPCPASHPNTPRRVHRVPGERQPRRLLARARRRGAVQGAHRIVGAAADG